MKFIKTISLLALITMLTACASQAINSAPADASAPTAEQSVTEETEEPEYSVDLVLTVTFPNKTKYTSTDNGVTWTTDGETVYFNHMPAYFTVIHRDPISISGEVSIAMTIHNNNHKTDLLIGGSDYEILRCDENGEWVIPEYADKTKNYGITDQGDVIYFSKNYYGHLSLYEPIAGRYRLTKAFTIDGSAVYGLMNPSDPGGTYIMSAEFNALP